MTNLGSFVKDRIVWQRTITYTTVMLPDSKVRVANMGPTWGRQDPGGPHVDPMNFAIRGYIETSDIKFVLLWIVFFKRNR